MKAYEFSPRGTVTISGRKGIIKEYNYGDWWLFRGRKVRAASLEEAVIKFEMMPCCKQAYDMGVIDTLLHESKRNGEAIKTLLEDQDAHTDKL